MRLVSIYSGLLCLVLMAGLGGCIEGQSARQPKADAVAVLRATSGSEASGIVRFVRTENGVRIMARLTNLTPGLHGFHIHEYGDCRAADATSAGGHFNPSQEQHGGPDAQHRHAGDLGNVQADGNGVATLDLVSPLVHIDGPDSVIGRSVIVHADPDDLVSQPTGSSGARLACGVIGWAGR